MSDSFTLKITHADVGVGDSCFLSFGDEHVMIDAGKCQKGGGPSAIARYPGESFKYVIISHSDIDHMGGLISERVRSEKIEGFKRATFYYTDDEVKAGLNNDCPEIQKLKRIEKVKRIYLGKKEECEICMIPNILSSKDKNEKCPIIIIKYKEYAHILMGDATLPSELKLDKRSLVGMLDRVTRIGLLVPHHGAKKSNKNLEGFCRELVSERKRKLFFICSAGNMYDHPSLETLKSIGSLQQDCLGEKDKKFLSEKKTRIQKKVNVDKFLEEREGIGKTFLQESNYRLLYVTNMLEKSEKELAPESEKELAPESVALKALCARLSCIVSGQVGVENSLSRYGDIIIIVGSDAAVKVKTTGIEEHDPFELRFENISGFSCAIDTFSRKVFLLGDRVSPAARKEAKRKRDSSLSRSESAMDMHVPQGWRSDIVAEQREEAKERTARKLKKGKRPKKLKQRNQACVDVCPQLQA